MKRKKNCLSDINSSLSTFTIFMIQSSVDNILSVDLIHIKISVFCKYKKFG